MNQTQQMDDLGHEYPVDFCGPNDSHGVREKNYPEVEVYSNEMTSVKGMNVGDKVKMVLEGEIVTISKRDNYGSEDSPEKETNRVSIKLMTGFAKKVGENAMDKAEEENQEDENEDTATVKDKQRKITNKFNKVIDVEGEDED